MSMGSPGGRVVDVEARGCVCCCWNVHGLFWVCGELVLLLKFIQVCFPPNTLSASRCAFPRARVPAYHVSISLSPGALYLITSHPRFGLIPFWNCITSAAPLKFVSMASDLKLST